MSIELIQYILSLISGLMVGFSLGLIGGGGSILAIPLLLYFVGYDHPHIAIGTTALAVGINAYLNLIPHALNHNVVIKKGIYFTIPGIVGVLIGTELGLLTPGKSLLFFFAILMIGIAALMVYRTREKRVNKGETKRTEGKDTKLFTLLVTGLAVGFASGYFGIGGGFLIVPGLLFSTDLPIIQAIGTSLMSVGTFGIVTAIRYGIAGKINILFSVLFVLGGVGGGWIGTRISSNLPRKTLTYVFAAIIVMVAIYMMVVNYSSVL
ncbi:sulfite exporter TauE/SafE family protein [Cuniculiplasma sp. SKW3]|uniref:sulfite exporter TauE/SafE family protein n=1 Tax=unclassified Cuniculiplasma TaxID=2619706 RepID=UPI003FD17450